jgi:hypothetical protein
MNPKRRETALASSPSHEPSNTNGWRGLGCLTLYEDTQLAKDQCSPSHGTSKALACLLPVPGAAGCQVGDSFCCCHPSMMAIFIRLRYRNPNQKQSSSSESHPASLLAWLRCLCFFREPSSLACWHDSAASNSSESSM